MPKYLATNKTKRTLSVWTPSGDVVVLPSESADVILTVEQFKSVDAVSDLSFEQTGDDEPVGVAAPSFVSADDGKLKSELDAANATIESLRADLEAAKKGLEHQEVVITEVSKDRDAKVILVEGLQKDLLVCGESLKKALAELDAKDPKGKK